MNEDNAKKTVQPLKLIKITLAAAFWIILAAIFIVPIFRLFQLDNFPPEMENFMWTDAVKQAYEQHPDSFHVYEISVAQNFTNATGSSRAGDFFVFFGRLVETDPEQPNQIQATIRYNDSTLEHRGDINDDSAEPFVYLLCDDLGNIYQPSKSVSAEKSNLNYRKLIYDGVDMAGVGRLYINIYHSSAFDISKTDTTAGMTDEGIDINRGIDPHAFSYLQIFDSSLYYDEVKIK